MFKDSMTRFSLEPAWFNVQVGVFNTTWLARFLLRELAAEGKDLR